MSGLADIVGGATTLATVLGRAWVERVRLDAADPARIQRRHHAARGERLARALEALRPHVGELRWRHVGDAMIEAIGSEPVEVAVAVVDDHRAGQIVVAEIGCGGRDSVDLDDGAVVRLARDAGDGSHVIVAHNHPADDEAGPAPWPSGNDLRGRAALREMMPAGVTLDEIVVTTRTARLVACSRLVARAARRNRR